jgi:hypothetical protein
LRSGGLDPFDVAGIQSTATRGHLATATIVDDLVERAGRHLSNQLGRQLPRLVCQLRGLLMVRRETPRYEQTGASLGRVLADDPLVRGAVHARLSGLCRVAVTAAVADLEDQDPGAVAGLWSLVDGGTGGESRRAAELAVALLDADLLGTTLSRQIDRACATTTVVAGAPTSASARGTPVG